MVSRLIVFVLLLVPCAASAQKTKYVGDYVLGKSAGDTLRGRLFVSVDSFKFIYQVSVKNGQDYTFPVFSGVYDIGPSNEIIFRYKDGTRKTGKFKLQEFSGGVSLLRLNIGNQVFTRSPSKDQLHEMHH